MMSPKLSRKLKRVSAAVLMIAAAQASAFSFITDKEGAMIITKANIADYRQGTILGGTLFGSVAFSHKESNPEKGILTFQTKTNPSAFRVSTTVENESIHRFAEAPFIDAIRKLVGAENIGPTFRFYTDPGIATDFGPGGTKKILQWYLLEKKSVPNKDLPAGSRNISDSIEASIEKSNRTVDSPNKYEPVKESILIQMGSVADIEAIQQQYSKSEGADIYNSHFRTLPVVLKVLEGVPGVTRDTERTVVEVGKLDLRYHLMERSGSVVFQRKDSQVAPIPICAVDYYKVGDNAYLYNFTIKASDVISSIVQPNLQNGHKLTCVEPVESKKSLSACEKIKDDPCGPEVIKGVFVDAPENTDFAGLKLPSEIRDNASYMYQLENRAVTFLLEPEDAEAKETYEYRAEIRLDRPAPQVKVPTTTRTR